jgi:predicted ATP-grasp superfamily ATP-dependent carboligase
MADESVPPSLTKEGDLMLRALLADLAEVPDVELTTLRDARLDEPDWLAEVYYVHDEEEFQQGWRTLVSDADAVWPIAPETGQRLEQLSRSITAAGKVLLNSRPEAVRVTTSKLFTARRLSEYGLPVVPTYRLGEQPPRASHCWVVKPDDGVGCLGARICRSQDELGALNDTAGDHDGYVIQPFVEGVPASLCLLCRDGDARLLSANLQRVVVANDEFHLLGCIVNGLGDDRSRYARMARAIAAALPGLWGLVGVDFIATERGPLVLEINPRITTSYAGLRSSLGENPAELVLELIERRQITRSRRRTPAAVEVCLEAAHDA